MRNIGVGLKLILGFFLVLLFFLTVIFFGWKSIRPLWRISTFPANEASDAMALAADIERKSYDMFYDMRRYTDLESAADLRSARQALAEIVNVLDNATAKSAAGLHLVDIRAFGELVPVFKGYGDEIDEAVRLAGLKHEAIKAMERQDELLRKSLDQLVNMQYAAIQNDIEKGDLQGFSIRIQRLRESERLYGHIEELRRRCSEALLTRNAEALNALIPSIDWIGKEMDDLVAASLQPEIPEIPEKLDEGKKLLAEFRKTLGEVVEYSVALLKSHEVRQVSRDALNAKISEIPAAIQKQIRDVSMQSVKQLRITAVIMIGGTVVALAAAAWIAFLCVRMVMKPLRTIVALARRAGAGDLTVTRSDFGYEGRDEFGTLVRALVDMIDSQEKSVEHVLSLAARANAGSEQLLAISGESDNAMREIQAVVSDVLALCESSAETLLKCSAGIEEMSTGVMTSVQSSADCAESIAQATKMSDRAIGAISDTICEMGTVNAKTQEGEHKAAILTESAERLGSFVSVIASVADRTGRLALNAEIETARAGDVGRGFTAVVEEVRKLAEESGRAAQNIEKLLAAFRREVGESSAISAESAEFVRTTLARAEEAQEKLNETLAGVNRVNDSIQSIVAVTEGQATSGMEIAAAIDRSAKVTAAIMDNLGRIRKSTGDTAKVADEVARQAEGMSSLARELLQRMEVFRIRETPAKALPAGRR